MKEKDICQAHTMYPPLSIQYPTTSKGVDTHQSNLHIYMTFSQVLLESRMPSCLFVPGWDMCFSSQVPTMVTVVLMGPLLSVML